MLNSKRDHSLEVGRMLSLPLHLTDVALGMCYTWIHVTCLLLICVCVCVCVCDFKTGCYQTVAACECEMLSYIYHIRDSCKIYPCRVTGCAVKVEKHQKPLRRNKNRSIWEINLSGANRSRHSESPFKCALRSPQNCRVLNKFDKFYRTLVLFG